MTWKFIYTYRERWKTACPPPRDILDSSSDLHLPVFRIPLLMGKVYKNTPRTIELKDAICQEIQAVNVDTLGKVFQNLEKRIQVCLAVCQCSAFPHSPVDGQSVQKYTPHNRTTQRRYTPRDSSRQRRHFRKSIPEFGDVHSSVLGCERRPVLASIMSRSCLPSFPVCVYKLSSHYLNNIIFYRQ